MLAPATPRMSMTPGDTIAATLRFEPTPVVPYHIRIEPEVEHRLDGHYGSGEWRDALVPYMYGSFSAGGKREALPGGLLRDQFGSICRQENISHVEEPVLRSPSLAGYKWPQAESLADWDGLRADYQNRGISFRLCGMAYGFFERAFSMRGFENILIDMVENPAFVDDLLDGYLELRMRVFDLIAAKIPVDGFLGGGDDCDQRGPIMGLERWRRFIKPRLACMIAHAHTLGKPLIAHMCGNVMPLVDDLIEIGLDALESLQPEAMDVYILKKKCAGKMALIGGMGTQSTLPFSSPQEIKAETDRLKAELGSGGGYVLGPAKPLMKDVPTANAVSFLEAAESRLGRLARD